VCRESAYARSWKSTPSISAVAAAHPLDRHPIEVVVWTPGLSGGRPLNLAVLPDFAVVTSIEEREQAVEMAWATLVPLIRATGSSKDLNEGLLKDALRSFSQYPHGGIEQFIAFLSDLPEGVSRLTKSQKLAAEADRQDCSQSAAQRPRPENRSSNPFYRR
jgi:hypothetical protein